MSVGSISTVKDEKLDAEIYFRGNISMCNWTANILLYPEDQKVSNHYMCS